MEGDSSAWDCEIDPADNNGRSGQIVALDIQFDTYEVVPDFGALESSVSTLEADITVADGKAVVTGNRSFGRNQKANNGNNGNGNGRRLDVLGAKTLLAVKIIAADSEYGFTEAFLSDSVFGTSGDVFNLATGYDQCSYGKLTFNKVPDRVGTNVNISEGVVSITVPGVAADGDLVLRDQVTTEITNQFGESPRDIADHAMYCMPPNSMNGIAYATVNGWMSVYSNQWCNYPAGQMHELGHNIGLDHS